MKYFFNKKRLILILLAMILSPAYGISSGEIKPVEPPLPKILEQVNLSEVQQERIKMILKDYRDDIDKLTKESDFSQSIVVIIKAEKFASKDAESLVDAMNEVRKKREMKKMQMMHQIFHTLTSDQQTQLHQLFSQPR